MHLMRPFVTHSYLPPTSHPDTLLALPLSLQVMYTHSPLPHCVPCRAAWVPAVHRGPKPAPALTRRSLSGVERMWTLPYCTDLLPQSNCIQLTQQPMHGVRVYIFTKLTQLQATPFAPSLWQVGGGQCPRKISILGPRGGGFLR